MMNKVEKFQWFCGIAVVAAMVALTGCGQTVQGVGKDIKNVGQAVEDWGKFEDSQ